MTLLALSSFVVPYVDRLADHGKLLGARSQSGSKDKGRRANHASSPIARALDAFLNQCTVRPSQAVRLLQSFKSRAGSDNPRSPTTNRIDRNRPTSRCPSAGSGTSTPSPASGPRSSSGRSPRTASRPSSAPPLPPSPPRHRPRPSWAWCCWRCRPCGGSGSPSASSSTGTRGCTWPVRGWWWVHVVLTRLVLLILCVKRRNRVPGGLRALRHGGAQPRGGPRVLGGGRAGAALHGHAHARRWGRPLRWRLHRAGT